MDNLNVHLQSDATLATIITLGSDPLRLTPSYFNDGMGCSGAASLKQRSESASSDCKMMCQAFISVSVAGSV